MIEKLQKNLVSQHYKNIQFQYLNMGGFEGDEDEFSAFSEDKEVSEEL